MSASLETHKLMPSPCWLSMIKQAKLRSENELGKDLRMTFVVSDACIKCKHTDCVEVCPVDCFYEGPNFLVINPDECIDCALCEPECPVDAIFSEDELPENEQQFLELNAELAETWPNITEKQDALPDAEEWADEKGKLEHLDR